MNVVKAKRHGQGSSSYGRHIGGLMGAAMLVLGVVVCTQAPASAAQWGPNSNGECDTMINSMTITSDNHNGTANNVGRHSSTTGYNEARPCFHWIGTGVNTPLNPNIVTTGGSFTHRITAAYDAGATAGIGAHILTSPWPNNGYSDSAAMVTWVYRDYPNLVAWTAQGGDFNPTELVRVNVIGTGTYTWTWTGTYNAGYGLIMRNRTSASSLTYRKTFAVNTNPRASLTLTYIPPSGLANSCVQNWNVIGTWPDSDASLDTSFLTSTDVRGVSEATMAARSGATYNGGTFAPSAQDNDEFNALAYGWGENCTGYGFVYVNYNHADNTAVYIGTGADERSKVWLNGTAVRTDLNGGGTWSADMNFFGPVTLKSGWNRVLIKAQTTGGDYGWSLRLANADRSGLGNCTFALTDTTPPTNPTACANQKESVGATWQTAAPKFTLTGAADPQGEGEGVSGARGCYYYWGTDAAGTSDTQAADMAKCEPLRGTTDGTYYLRVKAYDYALNTTAEWVTHYSAQCDGAPPTGVSLNVSAVTPDSIAVTATGTDATTGVNPDTGFNYSCGGLSDVGPKGTTHTWTGLAPNTEYTGLVVTVSDQAPVDPNKTSSAPQHQWTLSAPPTAGNVTPDNATVCAGSSVTWTAVGGFGAGKVQKYKYAWDQSPAHTWTEAEPDWSAGTIATTPLSAGTWYLHVRGYNGANVPNGSYDYPVTASVLPSAASVTRHRSPGTSLKIRISDLTADTLQSVGPTAHGALTTSSTHLIYEPASGDDNNDSFTYTAANSFSCTRQATVSIIVDAAAGPSATVELVGGKPTIRFAGIPSLPYAVERASDSSFTQERTTVLTTNAPANGLFLFVDENPPETEAYYRLRYNP